MYENFPNMYDNIMDYLNQNFGIGSFYIYNITNFMGHDMTIIVVQIFFFIGSYREYTDVIHVLVLLNIDVVCIV
jgi:hypothetical protein